MRGLNSRKMQIYLKIQIRPKHAEYNFIKTNVNVL